LLSWKLWTPHQDENTEDYIVSCSLYKVKKGSCSNNLCSNGSLIIIWRSPKFSLCYKFSIMDSFWESLKSQECISVSTKELLSVIHKREEMLQLG
jgi:hypothetical protein